MTLVVGLGNIGLEYENTPHNAGFMLLDLCLKDVDFLKLSNSKFKGELFRLSSSLLFLKPSTYMNSSGLSVKAVQDFYKCDRIIVLHDDIDLELGMLRFKKAGGNGGHNGLKSIDQFCGNNYERVRIGVGKQKDVSLYVLSKFKDSQLVILNKVLNTAKQALFELIATKDLNLISSKFSLKV